MRCFLVDAWFPLASSNSEEMMRVFLTTVMVEKVVDEWKRCEKERESCWKSCDMFRWRHSAGKQSWSSCWSVTGLRSRARMEMTRASAVKLWRENPTETAQRLRENVCKARFSRGENFTGVRYIPERPWRIFPAATLKLSACLCSHNPPWRWGSHFHRKRPRPEEGLPDHTGHLRATKKCRGPGCVSTGVKQRGLYPFWYTWCCFCSFCLARSVFSRSSVVDTRLKKERRVCFSVFNCICFQCFHTRPSQILRRSCPSS